MANRKPTKISLEIPFCKYAALSDVISLLSGKYLLIKSITSDSITITLKLFIN